MKLLAYCLVALAALFGLFHLFKSSDIGPGAVAVRAPAALASASVPSTAPEGASTLNAGIDARKVGDAQVVDLVVVKGRLISGPTIVHSTRDAHIVLHVTSDVAEELHLHGYDLHVKLKPHERATLEFIATKTGRFTYELHHADIELGAIEVYPH
jgi:hypothetical protein